MCGIAGMVSSDGRLEVARAQRMAARLAHRGPDGRGVAGFLWGQAGPTRERTVDAALAHTRLAVVDLTPEGAEPMANEDGLLQLTFNGEIYNHVELRRGLEGTHRFRSRCDAEVLLHGLESHGPTFFHELRGMFAFGLLSLSERALWLVRDPAGIKPLYLFHDGATAAFASELTALEAAEFAGDVDMEAVHAFLGLGFVPGPRTMRTRVRQVLPGEVLRVDASGVTRVMRLRLPAIPHHRSRAERTEQPLRDAVRASVKSHLEADVEVGVLLSGGVDSTLVASLAAEEHGAPVRAFTLAVDHPALDEGAEAARTAEKLGVKHHVRRLTSAEALARLPGILSALDEPLADASILPTRLVCELAREHVKVVLSGDGGDELLGGYTRHRLVEMLAPARHLSLAAPLLGAVADTLGDGTLDLAYRRVQPSLGLPPLKHPARKLRAALTSLAEPAACAYGRMFRAAPPDELAVLGIPDVASRVLEEDGRPMELADALSVAQHVDMVRWLPDDILRKVDRASMAVGLEARVPFLHAPVMEEAARLPAGALRQGRHGKAVLRRWVAERVGADVAWAHKRGFGVPLKEWLAGPLRGWRVEMLGSLGARGVVSPGALRTLQDAHDAGTDRSSVIFALCALEAWWQPRAVP